MTDRIDVPADEPELDPILITIPLQVLAYHAARTLGHDIDKPRNLAQVGDRGVIVLPGKYPSTRAAA